MRVLDCVGVARPFPFSSAECNNINSKTAETLIGNAYEVNHPADPLTFFHFFVLPPTSNVLSRQCIFPAEPERNPDVFNVVVLRPRSTPLDEDVVYGWECPVCRWLFKMSLDWKVRSRDIAVKLMKCA